MAGPSSLYGRAGTPMADMQNIAHAGDTKEASIPSDGEEKLVIVLGDEWTPKWDGAGLPPTSNRMANTTKACGKTLPRAASGVPRTPDKARNRTPLHQTRNEGPEADL